MTRREFLRELEQQLEIADGSLSVDTPLTELDGWDSLAAVLFIGLADERLGVGVSGNQVAKAKTLNELLLLLGDRLSH